MEINNMVLIADGGSTKTAWCLKMNGNVMERFTTSGVNPSVQNADNIKNVFVNELLPHICDVALVSKVYFYGAGCTPQRKGVLNDVFREIGFDNASLVIESDMLGAAKAVCGDQPGVVGILGTGSNSCLYDGEKIIANTPSLGYILGDEGSGAVLGKLFFNAMFKGRLSEKLCQEYLDESKLEMADVIRKVYREPLANRFLASTSLFIGKHIQDPLLSALVVDNFRSFLRNNILPYGRKDLPVNAIGSVAYYFKEQLMIAANAEGFTVGEILQSPMDGLLRYHSR